MFFLFISILSGKQGKVGHRERKDDRRVKRSQERGGRGKGSGQSNPNLQRVLSISQYQSACQHLSGGQFPETLRQYPISLRSPFLGRQSP